MKTSKFASLGCLLDLKQPWTPNPWQADSKLYSTGGQGAGPIPWSTVADVVLLRSYRSALPCSQQEVD